MKILVLDAEIKKMILGKDEIKDPSLEYCDGWHDFDGMGISVVCAYNYADGRYHVFKNDNFGDLQRLIDGADFVVGFNSIKFDVELLAANGITIPQEKNFDILVEMWRAAGIGPIYSKDKHHGYRLAQTVEANIDGAGKTGAGVVAPVLWQQGKVGQLIDYCLADVFITKKLMAAILVQAGLWSPKNDGQWLVILPPAQRRNRRTCINCEREFQGPSCPECGTSCNT